MLATPTKPYTPHAEVLAYAKAHDLTSIIHVLDPTAPAPALRPAYKESDFYGTWQIQPPPLLRGLYRVIDQLLLAQREAEKQLLAICWFGEIGEKGFTARTLEGFDLSLCAPEIAAVLENWKHCPLTDPDRRFSWLWAILFAKDLLLVATRYSTATDALPEHAIPVLLRRIQQLHAGRLAFDELETDWFDDPLHLVQAGQTPILTASPTVAAGCTQGNYVGLPVYDYDPDFLVGEFLAARPSLIAITDDVPDADALVQQCNALGLKAILYSEKTA